MKRIYLMAVFSMIIAMGITSNAEAKSKNPKLSEKKMEIEVGDKTKIFITNVTPKKVKWSVNKKSVVSLSKKKIQSVVLKAKKSGNATITAKVKVKGKKTKTLKLKVKVTKKSSKVTIDMKKQTAFPGVVTVTLNSDGYPRIKWSEVTDAHAYVVQRKTLDGNWKQLKVTASLSYTDKTVEEDSVYEYRVRANCDGMCTKYSDGVKIETKSIKTEDDYDIPAVTPEPTEPSIPDVPEPEEELEEEPYVPKYSYKVTVLNKFAIYENVPIVLFIETDNPNPNDFNNVYTSLHSDSVMGGADYDYEDVQYVEQENTNTTFFNKVNGGWIYTISFNKPGRKVVKIEELEKGEERNTWQTVDTFEITVLDGEKSLQEHCNKLIDIVSDNNYADTKWEDLTPVEKLERLEYYVRTNMHYPRFGAVGSLGAEPIWVIQENVGAFWETGFADCGASAEMMCVLARTLGYEAQRKNTRIDGVLHIQAVVTIDGVEHTFDATPYQGGYGDWDYII